MKNTTRTALALAATLAPVSYTHLDVYKRQGIGHPSLPILLQAKFGLGVG